MSQPNGSDSSPSEPLTFSAEEFFATQERPPRLASILEGVSKFVERHAAEGRKVVLVTSGGTTVPLEHNVVRFLDNFSAGTRGAASAEQFLRTGEYAVIFLHRQHSLQPFSRHYSHSTNPFLDMLEVVTAEGSFPSRQSTFGAGKDGHGPYLFPNLHALALHRASIQGDAEEAEGVVHSSSSTIQVKATEQKTMKAILESYKLVQSLHLLHSIPFVTVFEYLFLLRGISKIMNGEPGTGAGRRSLFYLAAAVSDFFLPQQKMSQHKIQSGKGSLVIEMDQVPKILRTLVEEWSSDGFIVSFKLETDRNLIIPKARAALERYGHQIVIGNDLHTRKSEVVFVQPESEPDNEQWVRISEQDLANGVEIEEQIVARLIEMHEKHIAATKA